MENRRSYKGGPQIRHAVTGGYGATPSDAALFVPKPAQGYSPRSERTIAHPAPRDASGVQRRSNLPQGSRARLLRLADDWENIGRVAIRLGLHGAHGILASPTDLGG
jgi:hypothetical protein